MRLLFGSAFAAMTVVFSLRYAFNSGIKMLGFVPQHQPTNLLSDKLQCLLCKKKKLLTK